MKKPEKQTPLCPLIQKECVEDGCKFWLTMERRNLVSGARETYQECAFVVQVAVMGENSMALNRTTETVQAARNETMDAIRNHTLAMAVHLNQGFNNVQLAEKQRMTALSNGHNPERSLQ